MGMLDDMKRQVVTVVHGAGSDIAYMEVPTEVKVHKSELNYDDDDRNKNILVTQSEEDDYSKSTGYLRAILSRAQQQPLGQVVILGSEEGGWSRIVVEEFSSDWIHSYLWWKNHERPALIFHHSQVSVKTQDIGTVEPYECHALLCNMQPNSLRSELANLEVLARWLKFKPKIFVIRVINFRAKEVLSRLKDLQKGLNNGRLIGIVNQKQGPLVAVYFVHGQSIRSLKDDANAFASRNSAIIELGGEKTKNGKWPIPDNLPVEQLAPLDMGATLQFYGTLHPPEGRRKFLKEIGWLPLTNYKSNNDFHRSRLLRELIKPLFPLIENHQKWVLTYNDPDILNKTINEKIDHAPQENHKYHEHLWVTYHAIAMFLKSKGGKVYRLSDEELELSSNKQSTMGWQERELECSDVGEYLIRSDIWKSRVANFKRHLLADRPINADYNSSGKREPKCENKTRMVWSLCGTGRLYEAQVLGSADKLLNKLPYTVKGTKPQDYGELFDKLLNQATVRHAVCDDIKGWDTKISYSMLCMEAAFLQLLAEDDDHKNEIRQLYRLYAHALVNIIEPYLNARGEKQYRKVFYQLQGQVASGRRVTYCMNTITNIAVTMTRAAVSQGIKLKDLDEWVTECLKWPYTHKYNGKISGDDTVIILGKYEAKLFATRGAEFMNAIGLIRKKTGTDESQVESELANIEFCSRNFVEVPMYINGKEAISRLIPIRKVGDILMRKLLREENFTHDDELAWLREQGKSWLIDYFHIPTIRMLALAILSVTPNNIALTGETGDGWCLTSKPTIQMSTVINEINEHYFGKGTTVRNNYRARSLRDLGYISKIDRNLYDLEFSSNSYKSWESKLPLVIEKLRESGKPYDDWIEVYVQEIPQSNSRTIFYLFILFACAFLLYNIGRARG